MSQTKQEEIKAQVTSILKEVEANPLQLRIVIQRLCEENASLKDQLAITKQKLQVFEQARAGIKAASRTSGGPSSSRSVKPTNPSIGRPCSPPARPPTTSSAQPTPSLPSAKPAPSLPSVKPTPLQSSAKPAPSTLSAKPAPAPVPQKPPQDPEDRRRATEELWKAVKEGVDDRAVEAAVEAGADVRVRNVDGETPLHWAAGRGREAAVLCLISHGAELEAKSTYGWTPLHNAAIYGHLLCTKLLVERGADLNARECNGYTPLALAVLSIKPTVQQYLESVGGTR